MDVGIHVELARNVDAPSVAEALSSRGLDVEIVSNAQQAEVLIGGNSQDLASLRSEVASALEGWVGARSVPLVPTPVGADGFSLHPPAG